MELRCLATCNMFQGFGIEPMPLPIGHDASSHQVDGVSTLIDVPGSAKAKESSSAKSGAFGHTFIVCYRHRQKQHAPRDECRTAHQAVVAEDRAADGGARHGVQLVLLGTRGGVLCDVAMMSPSPQHRAPTHFDLPMLLFMCFLYLD